MTVNVESIIGSHRCYEYIHLHSSRIFLTGRGGAHPEPQFQLCDRALFPLLMLNVALNEVAVARSEVDPVLFVAFCVTWIVEFVHFCKRKNCSYS